MCADEWKLHSEMLALAADEMRWAEMLKAISKRNVGIKRGEKASNNEKRKLELLLLVREHTSDAKEKRNVWWRRKWIARCSAEMEWDGSMVWSGSTEREKSADDRIQMNIFPLLWYSLNPGKLIINVIKYCQI